MSKLSVWAHFHRRERGTQTTTHWHSLRSAWYSVSFSTLSISVTHTHSFTPTPQQGRVPHKMQLMSCTEPQRWFCLCVTSHYTEQWKRETVTFPLDLSLNDDTQQTVSLPVCGSGQPWTVSVATWWEHLRWIQGNWTHLFLCQREKKLLF